jgi:hypothetical protein
MKLKIKTNKLSTITITLLIIAYVVPLCIAADNAQQLLGQGPPSDECKYPDVPGAPDNAVQYNKTDITPIAATEQVQAGQTALFQYKNMTMLMNSSQNCEVIFTADPKVTPKILGLSVDPNQTMTLTMNMYQVPLQGEQVMERTLNFYLGIEPNSEQQLSAQIRLHVNQTELNEELNREVNISKLSWMYWNQTQAQWKTVESFMDQNGYLVCNTDHFSTWTVAEVNQETEPIPATQDGIQSAYVYIAAVLVVIVIAALLLVIYQKRK